MKVLLVFTLAALGLASQTVPTFAHGTGTVTLIPISAVGTGLVTAGSRCNKPAAIDGDAYVEEPAIAMEQGVSGTALVKIDLSAKGALAGEAMFESSGNPWLDRAALESPAMTHFTPEIANCTAVGGSYLYRVDF